MQYTKRKLASVNYGRLYKLSYSIQDKKESNDNETSQSAKKTEKK